MTACNEARAVRTAAGLARGSAEVVTVPADAVDPRNEGRLVHVQGQAGVDRPLVDDTVGVEARALRLVRKVEMCQWKEETIVGSPSGPHEYRGRGKTFRYRKTWSEERLHLDFEGRPRDYTNPDFPLRGEAFEARTMRVGAFAPVRVPSTLMTTADQALPLGPEAMASLSPAWKPRAKLSGGAIYWGNPDAPAVGDLRISYHHVPPAAVTVIGRQAGATLEGYASAHIPIALWGSHPPEALFRQERQSEGLAIGIVRVFLTGVVLAGVMLLFLPLRALARVVAGLDLLAAPGFFLFAPLLTAAVMTAAMAWAWRMTDDSFSRLLFGISVVAMATLVFLGALRNERRGLSAGVSRRLDTPPQLPEDNAPHRSPPGGDRG
jgi:hypothetical protein